MCARAPRARVGAGALARAWVAGARLGGALRALRGRAGRAGASAGAHAAGVRVRRHLGVSRAGGAAMPRFILDPANGRWFGVKPLPNGKYAARMTVGGPWADRGRMKQHT